MLKYVALLAFCVLAWLSACEPGGEWAEPVALHEPEPPAGDGGKVPDDAGGLLDSNATQALAEVNAARQKGCLCGDVRYPPTAKVRWNAKLYEAALAHAKDMHENGYFGHTSPSGGNIHDRLTQSGYITDGRAILAYGENIAFGDFDLKAATQKWLDSPSHCANLMRDTYREMAVAQHGRYWVQVFGATRE